MEANSLDENIKDESLKSGDFKLSSFNSPLIIGFDGKRAARNFTGLGNYSRYLINILGKFFPENQYRVYSPQSLDKRSAAQLGYLPSVSFCYPKINSFKNLWRSYGIIRDLKADGIQIFHGLSNEIPFGIKKSGIKTAVTIHDLIFLRYPQYYPWLDRKIYQFKFRYASRNADMIIAISEQTKRDIIKFYNIPQERIEVIYQNCNAAFQKNISAEELEAVRIRYSLPGKYLLNVGTIEPRKNLMLIVQALKSVDSDIHLVVIGKETNYAEKVKDFIRVNDLKSRVHFLKNVPLEDLPAIYRQAEIFIFPSEFEGFGIPIVEALHSKIPVIAASGSCLEEAGGPGSLYIRPDDENGLSIAINSVLNDIQKRESMIKAGSEYVKNFSDIIIAGKIMQLYKNLQQNAKRRN